jgi:hypothetical protein
MTSAAEMQSNGHATTRENSGVTWRSVGLAILFVFLVNLVVSRVELVIGRYVASGIPPIPAVLVLAILVALRPLGDRLFGRFSLSRKEILTIYCLMLVSVPFCATYGIRSFLPRLTVLQYYGTPENHFGDYAQYVPSWFAPTNQPVIETMYEGTAKAGVPWEAWLPPLGMWTLFFAALFVTALSLMTIMARQWAEAEKLPFPLAQFPMELVESHKGGGLLTNFFTNPLAWIGIGLAFVYNAMNVAKAFSPGLPAIAQDTSLDGFFTEHPWDALRPLVLNTYPGSFGFGYLVSQELLGSVVIFTFLAKFLGLAGRMVGYEPAGFPYWQEQSAGGFVMMAAVMLWASRGHLRQVWQRALGHPGVDDSQEALPYRLAVGGLVVGTVFFLVWCGAAGLTWKIALPFWLIVLGFALVYGRIRAEAGIPHDFVYPYRLPQFLIVNAVGPRRLLKLGGPRSIVIFEIISFLSRFHPTQLMTGFQTDALQIARLGNIKRRSLAPALIVIFVLGLGFAFWGHFSTFYGLGLNVLEGNPRNADWRTNDTIGAFTDMVNRLEHPGGPDGMRTTWAVGGALVALGLTLARTLWLRFPLHPLGFIIALSYGPTTMLWFPFTVIFLLKWALLKVGGIGAFRRLIPLFMGLVLGHYVFGGVAWPILSLFLENSISGKYYTVF